VAESGVVSVFVGGVKQVRLMRRMSVVDVAVKVLTGSNAAICGGFGGGVAVRGEFVVDDTEEGGDGDGGGGACGGEEGGRVLFFRRLRSCRSCFAFCFSILVMLEHRRCHLLWAC
jgi:hypothetical protein